MKRLTVFVGAVCVLLMSSLSQAQYSRDQAMSKVNVNGVEIAYTQAGDLSAPPVLLVMGLTASHRLWGEDFVNGIIDAGYRVVLFDNRDTGESARLDELGTPTLWWQMLKATIGFDVDAPYSLNDMAADAIAVLDALNIERAHIVGASMGGMIAQIIAADYPDRTQSLVSIMSTTGAPHLPEAQGGAGDDLLELGDSDGDMQAQLEELGMFPDAMPRQLMAIVSAGDRSEDVARIKVPTLVLHGANDNLLPKEHGKHTHEMISGSKFVVYEGMGHDMPPEVVPLMLQAMAQHFPAAG
ncbi:MAG: alpha/beta fold hydrolase [bacterium]